jgi:transcriptional regulator with XRE-family HTH domain
MQELRPITPEPSALPVRIGARLRAARQAQNLTIAQVAEAAGLTKGFVSRIERDETSPSVATLVALCQVLSMPVGLLFEEIDATVVPLADAPRINFGGHRVVDRLVTPRGQSRLQMLRSTLDSEAYGGDELYTINCDVEVLHVISGEITIEFTDRFERLRPGDTITFPGREPHNWRNVGDGPAEVIWTIIPASWNDSS